MCIRFGLAAIKGIGEVAVESILKARNETGRFKSLPDMCERLLSNPLIEDYEIVEDGDGS